MASVSRENRLAVTDVGRQKSLSTGGADGAYFDVAVHLSATLLTIYIPIPRHKQL